MLGFFAVLATSPRGLEVTGAAQFTLPVPGQGLRPASPLYVSVSQLQQAEGSGPGLKSFTEVVGWGGDPCLAQRRPQRNRSYVPHSKPWTGILTEWCTVPTKCPILTSSSRSPGLGQRLCIVDGQYYGKQLGLALQEIQILILASQPICTVTKGCLWSEKLQHPGSNLKEGMVHR